MIPPNIPQLSSTNLGWYQWELILRWRYCTVRYKAIFCGDIPLHRHYTGLIYGRYLQFRFLKFWVDIIYGRYYSTFYLYLG